MSLDLSAYVRNQLRQAAADYILEQALVVADEITGHSEELAEYASDLCETCNDIHDNYIPEVEQGGARDFGQGPIIGREERKERMRGLLHNLQGEYAAIAAWVEAAARESAPQADQDHGDSQPADVAPAACFCQRRHSNGYVCYGSPALCGSSRL